MKWFNHILIAGSTCAVIAPALVPVAILGGTAPDWLEWVLSKMGRKVKHRTVTHVVFYWACGLAFFLLAWDFRHIGAAFFYGGLTHVLADAMTIMGVPLWPNSDRRTNLFGGRFRTGQSGEYIFSGILAGVCFIFASQMHTASDFFPFFYNWQELYQNGTIDAYEWKQNRLNFI